MKRLVVKLGLTVMALGTLGGVVAPSISASAAKKPTINNTDLKRYYKSAKSKTAFYFKTYKSGGKTGSMLILGDFGSKPNVKYGVPTSTKLSKNRQTLTTKYKLIQFKTANKKTTTSLTKKTYTFKLTKKSSNKFTAKIAGTKANRHLATTGKTYTYTRTKTSPAAAYSKKYARPVLYKEYMKAFSSLSAAQQKKFANQYADSGVKTMTNNFNYKVK
ncbi:MULTISPECIES: hypothetical protein [Lactobacillaceae]|uniref:hypothetical protein n=1 Tax=Lactobacillaceae TaxID=33958 RepID=UPI001456BFA5|nr:hypothetical protein [Lactobacillus sp. HBUAS51381]NLR08802.1 hypothetical protein [Lactobacillus sp. HBUAS51381]